MKHSITRRFLVAALVLVTTCACRAWSEEMQAGDLFDKAYQVMRQADDARDSDNLADAVRLFEQALRLHLDFAKQFPAWQPKMVNYRTNYCNNQIDALFMKIDALEPDEKEKLGPIEKPAKEDLSGLMPKSAAMPDNAEGRAISMLHQGNGKDARIFLLDALKADPDNKALRLLIGVALCQEGKYEDAFYVLTELVKEDGENARVYVALATTKMGLGRIRDAVEDLRLALERNPEMAEAHFNLAQALRLSAPPDIKGSLHHYEKALGLGAAMDEDLNALALQ